MQADSRNRRCSRSWLAVSLLALGLAGALGCHQVVGESPEPRRVVVEGVVVQGDTFRVEPLHAASGGSDQTALQATVLLENGSGERQRVDCDRSGRFRIGPMRVQGAPEDRLVVSCPGNWTLKMSRLLPTESELRDDTNGVIRVQRKITLPPRGSRAAEDLRERRPS